MGRHRTLDEYLKAFTDEETESVQEAISVRVSDAEVYSLGQLFIQLMGGVAQCLRRPPKRRRRSRQVTSKKERESANGPTDSTEDVAKDDESDPLINERLFHEYTKPRIGILTRRDNS